VLQAVVMNKLLQKKLNKKDKKDLNDAMMASIAGISAAIKNTG
jgi:phosphoenolpyruvate carboxylase